MRNPRGLFYAAKLGICLIWFISSAQAQVLQEWAARYNGPGNSFDGTTFMVVDALGNVHITGFCDADSNGVDGDFATVKYNSSGAQQWVAIFNGPGDAEDRPTCLAVDGQGNVYVSGWSWGIGTDNDYVTIKYNSAGVQQWVAYYNGPGNGDDGVQSIALGADGSVYVTGPSVGLNGYWDQTTVKYNSAGVQQWVARYDGPGGFSDVAMAIAVDADGNPVITGWCAGGGLNYYDFCTVKYNSAGVQQWVAQYWYPDGGYNFDGAYALALDEDGNVYVAGQSDTDSSTTTANQDFTTIKYNSAGVQQWVAVYDGSAQGEDWLWTIAVDAAQNVYVAGQSPGLGSGDDAVTIKYNSAGAQQWVARYNGPANGDDGGYVGAVDAEGNIYVAGWRDGDNLWYGGDYVTIKYSPDGAQQWVAVYDGPVHDSDGAWGPALDAQGNVYVTGWSLGEGSNYDYLTIKYRQTGDYVITLTPINPPIQIPPTGGSFDFNATVENLSAAPVTFDVWLTITIPDGFTFTTLGPVELNLPASGSLTRLRTQNVPNNAPSGNYTLAGMIGEYPWVVWNSDSFAFEKISVGDGGEMVNDWLNFGQDFDQAGAAANMPLEYALFPAHPNPFNPSTVIRYNLPQASFARMGVFDISGRLVATLMDGWREAGRHEVTFDGTNLPSGIYLYRLVAGDFQASGKMVLMK